MPILPHTESVSRSRGLLEEMALSTHIKMITQVMLSMHHLIMKNYLIPQKAIPPLLS
jgi:hypothetical protein